MDRQRDGDARASLPADARGPLRLLLSHGPQARRGEELVHPAHSRSASGRWICTDKIGRRYAGKVQQIISGSIGFDDWEWGVDLFADDPVIFKKLIYEMRFDEVSGVFSNFGAFYVGLRCAASELPTCWKARLRKRCPGRRPCRRAVQRRP